MHATDRDIKNGIEGSTLKVEDTAQFLYVQGDGETRCS